MSGIVDEAREREAFEMFILSRDADIDYMPNFDRSEDGAYYNDEAENDWIVWRARAKQDALPRWIAVSEQLPESGSRVTFAWKNSAGHARTSMGYHASKHSMEAPSEWDSDFCDSVSEGAIYYIPEGWYEEGHEIEDCASIRNVTHWQPLPKPPGEAP